LVHVPLKHLEPVPRDAHSLSALQPVKAPPSVSATQDTFWFWSLQV